jgi:ATP-dependent RNA helicase DeaD
MYIPDIRIIPVYGGASINEQIKQAQKGVHIIVATPGRLIDLIERKAVKINHVHRVILDEADEMLNMGFLDSINEILSHLPEQRNTLLFSATMPAEILTLTKKYMHAPVEVTIGERNAGADNIKHLCYTVHAKDKYLVLKRVADFYPDIYAIVFCRTRRETQEVADKLIQDGYNAESLHGDLSQTQRELVMSKFRVKNIQLLVATDVAARGIDVQDLTHVINYNLPEEVDQYTHRSGRTGRAGKAGISVSIINLKEKKFVKQIEKRIGKQFIYAKVPTGKEVCEKQLFHLINKIETVEIDTIEIEPFLPALFKKLDWFDKEELIKRLVSVEFNRFLKYYKDAVDLNETEEHRGEAGKHEKRRSIDGSGNYTRMYLNIGKIDGLNPPGLMNILNEQMPGQKFSIGEIEILKKHCVFEIEKKAVKKLLNVFDNTYLDNRRIVLKIDHESGVESRDRDRGERPPRRDGSGRRDRGKREGDFPTKPKRNKKFRA